MRKIVRIDEDKCDGCGLCVPSCAEGAIQVVDGKARLLAEDLCDGLGNCLGECPKGAITIEQRPAEAFDQAAVQRHRERLRGPAPSVPSCPGAMLRMLNGPASGRAGGTAPAAGPATTPAGPPRLTQWPVQLALLPPAGEIWQDADVVLAADCAAYAMGDFHERILADGPKTLAIACPKLDDVEQYVEKLTRIFAGNTVRSVTVVHMEVPCCSGLVYAARTALERAKRTDVSFRDVTVGLDGRLRRES